MKLIYILIAVAVLAGCGKSDERKEVGQQADRGQENTADKAKPGQVGDVEGGKAIAAKCARCHGLDGVLASQGAPFIAGLGQGYLASAIQAYADGLRKNEPMRLAVAELQEKPELIANVSAYYASLKTPWKGANVGNTSDKPMVSLSPDNIKAGASLAAGCNSCHGEKGGAARNDAIPKIAGMAPEYFIPSLKSYFSGKRDHGVMKQFGVSLGERQIGQLAAYYATLPPVKLVNPGSGNAKAGEQVAGMCAGCHSVDGNALNPEIPSLAGQPAKYLIKAMKDYRDGRRKDQMMVEALHKMQDQTIADLAAYYAGQKFESALSRARQGTKKFDPVAEGRRIAGSCDGCHGRNGNSSKAGVPSLTGLNVKYLIAATREYRSGARKHDVMKKMVGRLSDTDIEKTAFYYATQEPVARKQPPKADLATGEKVGSGCTACHGAGGVSASPMTPSLAGQDAGYIEAATRAYASGARGNTNMTGAAKGLKPEEIVNAAAYFSSLKAARPDTKLPEMPQYIIVEKCNRCHGERGKSTDVSTPSLAGQAEAYLVLAIKEYQDGTRKNKFMNAMSDVLSLVEIKAIAAYYARQQ